MKKYIFLFFAIVASGLFTSCSDQLDLQSDGRITMSSIFTDRYRTMGYLNSCYGYCPFSSLNMDWASYSDEAEDSDDNTSGSRFGIWYSGSIDASSFSSYSVDGNPWTTLYEGIRKCDVFLSNIWTSTAYATDEEKEGWAAQAHTLRALYYLQLIKRYGGVPIVDDPLAINYDFSKSTKSKFSEVVKFILTDCDSALKAPATQNGFPWEIYNNQYGIMSRAIPYAIKSEAITYAVSPLWSDGTYTWTDATAINKEALYQCLTHDYKLFNVAPSNNAAQNAYAYYFITNFANDYQRSQDKETIYQGSAQMSVWKYAGMPSNASMIKTGPSPTQELIDSYEMADGTVPITGYNDNEHLSPIINTASSYDPNNPYNGRDPRFYASIYYNGALRYLNQPTGYTVQSYVGGTDGISQTDRTHTRTGYYMRKFNNYQSRLNTEADGAIRLFRLGELYMNFAESAYQSVGPDTEITLGSGMTMSARDAVNAIRERAGMPDLASGMGKEEFEKRYRNERRIEFAFEGHRFFDVRRWKILSATDHFVSGMQISKSGSNYTYTRIGFTRNCYSDKWLLYPIGLSEVNKMVGYTGIDWQNSGW